MSFYFRSFDAIVFAPAFLLHVHKSLDRFMIFSRSRYLSVSLHLRHILALVSTRNMRMLSHTLSLPSTHLIVSLCRIAYFAAINPAVHRTRSHCSLPLLLFPMSDLKIIAFYPSFPRPCDTIADIEFLAFLG